MIYNYIQKKAEVFANIYITQSTKNKIIGIIKMNARLTMQIPLQKIAEIVNGKGKKINKKVQEAVTEQFLLSYSQSFTAKETSTSTIIPRGEYVGTNKPPCGGAVVGIFKKQSIQELNVAKKGGFAMQTQQGIITQNQVQGLPQSEKDLPAQTEGSQNPITNTSNTGLLSSVSKALKKYTATPNTPEEIEKRGFPSTAGDHNILAVSYCAKARGNLCATQEECTYECPTYAIGHGTTSPNAEQAAKIEGSTYVRVKHCLNSDLNHNPNFEQGLVFWKKAYDITHGAALARTQKKVMKNIGYSIIDEAKKYVPKNPSHQNDQDNDEVIKS